MKYDVLVDFSAALVEISIGNFERNIYIYISIVITNLETVVQTIQELLLRS